MALNKQTLKKIIAKLKYKLIGLIIDNLFYFFKIIPAAIKKSNGIRVIVFHGITENNPHKFNARFITKTHLETLITLLKKYCHLISYADFVTNKLAPSKLNVLISFDDGYKNNFEEAYPLLLKHNVPAVFFVTCCHLNKLPYLFNDVLDIAPYNGKNKIVINNQNYFKTKIHSNFRYVNAYNEQLAKKYHFANLETRNSVIDQLFAQDVSNTYKEHARFLELMTEHMLITLSKHQLFTIGAHGKNHLSFTTMNTTALEEEINDSVNYLKKITGKEAIPLAFPYGEYNQAALNICLKNNIKNIFGTEHLHDKNHKQFITERMQSNPFISPIRQLYYIAKGKYA